jgi:hypothetical protein
LYRSSSPQIPRNIPGHGLSKIKLNNLYGFINTKGQLNIPCTYDWAYDFSDDIAGVKKDGHYYYINKKGVKIIAQHFEKITPFYNGKAMITIKGKTFLIDTQGKIIKEVENKIEKEF